MSKLTRLLSACATAALVAALAQPAMAGAANGHTSLSRRSHHRHSHRRHSHRRSSHRRASHQSASRRPAPPALPVVALRSPDAGKVHGLVPAVRNAAGETRTSIGLSGTSFASTANLAYNGGPVMHSSTTYAIYWEPSGSTVSANYASLINGYFANVAAASGTAGNVYSPDVQYSDTTGPIAYSSTFGGSYVDASTPIPDDCSGQYAGTGVTVSGCLTDADIQTEVARVLAATGWTPGANKEFFVFTPRNVGSCLSSTSSSCAYTYYCAYHSSYADGLSRQVLYANMPYADTSGVGAPGACDSYQHPNGDWADATISLISHEHNESITDPLGNAWYDTAGNEDGDKCSWNFGSALGSTTYGQYNQVIGTGKYYVQQEWSNASSGCVLAYTGPMISSFTPTSGASKTSVTITGANFTGASAVKFNGTSSSFTVKSATSISTSVPTSATSGPITVTTTKGTATSASNFWVPATITGLSATSGHVGTVVTVSGTNFTGATSVKFNGVSASFTVSSATSISATVPTGATSGYVTVTTPAGTTTSASQFWLPATITGLSSTAGSVGTVVTISGTNFTGATYVKFNGVSASFKVSSATTISATVPTGATSGYVTVTTPAGTATSPSQFWLPATITGLSYTSGKVGTVVTISGTNFTGATAVKFNGVEASFSVTKATSISVTVPSGATTGHVSVTTPAGTVTSSATFTVLS